MDGTRARRTGDKARQAWYARHRQWRFARFLGFDNPAGRSRPPQEPTTPTYAMRGSPCSESS